MKLNEPQIHSALDMLADKYGDIPGFRSVREAHDESGTFFIMTVEDPSNIEVDSHIVLNIRGKDVPISVVVEAGPAIVPSFYPNVQLSHDPLGNWHRPIPSDVVVGGQQIWHTALGGWGTLAFTAIEIEMRNGRRCHGRNVALSNNHVLALWDRAAAGDVIEAAGHNNFGTLHCWLPVTGTGRPNDTAMARVTDVTHTAFGTIQGIGQLAGVAKTRTGWFIQKSGARTGVTTGTTDGFATIRVNGVLFRSVRGTSRGFACRGDSGSAVLDRQRRMVGIFFAGEDRPCDGSPVGYFIPTVPMRGRRQGGAIGVRVAVA